jgi:hypothetical protein
VFYSSTANLTDPQNLYYAIQTYCETTEPNFVNNIPTFVILAEERIYNSVQLPAIRRNQTGVTSQNNRYLSLPSDWLATFSLAVINPATGEYSYLLDKDVNFIRESYPVATSYGMPQHYAIFDSDSLILGPTPDAAYQVELHYYYYPASIVTAGTSWLGTNFETVLLYGAVREGYTYLKGETDIAASYEAKYQEALALLKTLGDGKDRRDAYRSGQARVPVT